MYPQPNSNEPVLKGLNYYRLFTELTSPGDIYETEVGSNIFAIGPDSDIANIAVAYFDPQNAPTYLSQVSVGVERAVVGLIPARNDAKYLPSNRRARSLIYSLDLYNPVYVPPGFVDGDGLTIIPPVLDVWEYFEKLPSVTSHRNDKTWKFQDFPSLVGHSNYIVIPYYGRKYAMMNYTNRSAGDISLKVIGVNLGITTTVASLNQEKTLHETSVVNAGASVLETYNAGDDGMFDVLVIKTTQSEASSGFPSPLRVVVSDVVAAKNGGV